MTTRMTGTDEARRLLQRAFQLDLPKPLTADILAWLAANPESKPDAGVTEAQVERLADILLETTLSDVADGSGTLEVFMPFGLERENARLLARAALASAVPAAPETIPGESAARPWSDCKVAFGADDPDVVEAVFGDGSLSRRLPAGWSVDEMDEAGARCVIVFRVDGFLRVKDGESVERLLIELGVNTLPAAPAVSQPPADTRETGNG